jgi:type II secretory pathway pseudopilin PulG
MKSLGRPGNERGYAMAVLLVGLSVMGVLVTVAMPVWKQSAQREKEAELVFRGQQYVRAITLFQRKHGPGTLPPTLEVLVDEHDLRKKFKDPITNDDFQVIVQGPGTTPASGPSTPGARGRGSQPSPVLRSGGQRPPEPNPGSRAVGGILGVQSKSTDESIRIYNGRSHYNEWVFVFQPPIEAPGTRARGALPPGQRLGGPGPRGGGPVTPTGPGGRGTPPTVRPGGRGPVGQPPVRRPL